MSDARAFIRGPGDGELITIAGVEHLFALTGADTGGRLGFEVFTLAPGAMGARPHVHRGHDEYFYVISGQLTVHDGDGEHLLPAGALLAALRGTPHGFRNAADDTVQGLCIFSPAGYENFFRDVRAAVDAGETLTDGLMARIRGGYDSEPYPRPAAG